MITYVTIFINGCGLSWFLYSSCEMHTLRHFCMITNVMSDYLSLFLVHFCMITNVMSDNQCDE